MRCNPFGRLIPAMVTPFKENFDIDFDRAQELAVRLINGGCTSVLVNATTGESPTISREERKALFSAVVEAVSGQVPVIANIGDNCTQDSVDFAKAVKPLGVDGFMAVTPYYNKPPQAGLKAHFGAIASVCELPLILYNIPCRCVINMLPETTLELARQFENIVAIKEASGNLDQVKAIVEGAPEGFCVYSGDDSLTFDIMKLGGYGVISTMANICPDKMLALVSACAAQDWQQAAQINEHYLPLMKGLFETTNPILVKEGLKLTGFSVGSLRLPLVPATPEQSAQLEEVLRSVGLL